MWFSGAFESNTQDPNALTYVVGFLFYLCQYTIIFFCNTALVGAALIRLRGGDPTVADGFRIASERIGPILGYAFIAATVGIILRSIAERAGFIGKIVISLIGFAWNVATFLVVPILAVENIGPIDAVKRSSQLLKQTWGEQLVGNAGIGLVFGLMTFGLILVGGAIVFAAVATGSILLMFSAIALVVVAVIGMALVGSALTGIYTAAVYNYTVTGQTGSYMSPELVRNAFTAK